MPSGLTCDIYDGSDMSLRGFVLRCTRQMGAGYFATEQGEKKLPRDKAPEIPVSDYHLTQIEKAKAKLAEYKELKSNPDELQKKYEDYCYERIKANIGYVHNKTDLKVRYITMMAKVQLFELDKEYDGLKELMWKKLNESMEHDCGYGLPYESEIPSIEEWIDCKIEGEEKDIEYHTKEYEKEKQHISECNRYLRGIYDALDKYEAEIEGKFFSQDKANVESSK